MVNSFSRAVDFVLRWEGGYVFDKDDPGGETSFGISKRAFPLLNIKELTKEEAIAIYRDNYWHKSGCDDLPTPLDLCVFDSAVQHGIGRAKTFLSRTTVPSEYLLERLLYYGKIIQGRPESVKYIRGWMNRVDALWRLVKQETDAIAKEVT